MSQRVSLWLWVATGVLLAGCAGSPSTDGSSQIQARFAHPADCASCHERQYREWQGSMMAYAAVSPVFNALEAAGNAFTAGDFAADGRERLFCQGCHSPISVALDEFPPYADTAGRPSRDFLGAVGQHGLSCDFCHQVAHANLAGSLLGDGIANAAFILDPGVVKLGPFTQPVANPVHESQPSDYIRSPEFCGSCHDVRLAPTDTVTGEPFLRLENAFTEWRSGPYATADNPYGRVITCQDCHMSAYPYAPPGTYFQDVAAIRFNAPTRAVSSHYFTGVDVALIDFPGQLDDGLDAHRIPIGQAQRRGDLLRAACTVAVETPAEVAPGEVLPIAVDVTNVGAGHNVPSGFSQERQMWIDLRVTDAGGTLIYQSGYLVDQAHPDTGEIAPDGRLNDEDLNDFWGSVDAATMEADLVDGPDRNQRPEVNLGLYNFGNQFVRVRQAAAGEVFMPFIANHMDNSHSVPPLQTIRVPYDVPLPEALSGPLHVSAQLRFRPFPPRFLRALAVSRPDLVSEGTVDRNLIIDMAEAAADVDVLQ